MLLSNTMFTSTASQKTSPRLPSIPPRFGMLKRSNRLWTIPGCDSYEAYRNNSYTKDRSPIDYINDSLRQIDPHKVRVPNFPTFESYVETSKAQFPGLTVDHHFVNHYIDKVALPHIDFYLGPKATPSNQPQGSVAYTQMTTPVIDPQTKPGQVNATPFIDYSAIHQSLSAKAEVLRKKIAKIQRNPWVAKELRVQEEKKLKSLEMEMDDISRKGWAQHQQPPAATSSTFAKVPQYTQHPTVQASPSEHQVEEPPSSSEYSSEEEATEYDGKGKEPVQYKLPMPYRTKTVKPVQPSTANAGGSIPRPATSMGDRLPKTRAFANAWNEPSRSSQPVNTNPFRRSQASSHRSSGSERPDEASRQPSGAHRRTHIVVPRMETVQEDQPVTGRESVRPPTRQWVRERPNRAGATTAPPASAPADSDLIQRSGLAQRIMREQSANEYEANVIAYYHSQGRRKPRGIREAYEYGGDRYAFAANQGSRIRSSR